MNFKHLKVVSLLALAFAMLVNTAHAGIFDTKENVAQSIATINETHSINSLAFSPDGKLLVAAKYLHDFSAQVWDWEKQQRVGPELKYDEINNLNRNAVQFSKSGNEIVWCGYAVAAWRVLDGIETYRKKESVKGKSCAAIAHETTSDIVWILEISHQEKMQTLVAYDSKTWQIIDKLDTPNFLPSAFSISYDGKFAAIAGRFFSGKVNDLGVLVSTQEIRIFDLVGRRQVSEFAAQTPSRTTNYIMVGNQISALAWSVDGNSLAVGFSGVMDDGGDALQILDSRTGKILSREPGAQGTQINGLIYTPDGKYLIASSISKKVKIWDEKHTRLLQEISAIPAAIAISPDGHYLALGGAPVGIGNIDGLLALMFPATGKAVIYKLR